MNKKSNAPTMKDVAQEAGVALGTVSKVVNGIPVGKAYQKKVEAAIKKLNYRVNSYAQGLKASKTYTVAFLVPNTTNPFFGGLTYYINQALAAKGYRMLLCATDGDTQTEQAHIDMALQNKVDGIICLSYNENLSVQAGTPLVTIDRHIHPSIPCVSSDNFNGGQMAAKQLIRLGCKHLLFLGSGSPLPNETSKRSDGFLNVCVMHNIPYDILTCYDGTPFSRFSDFLIQHTRDGALEYDGIFCVTDHLADQIVTFLRSQGHRVPEEVQVIGFDGIRQYHTGALLCSTIVQPVEQIAKMSVNLVLSEDWSKSPPLVCLPVHYAYGGTTKEESHVQ